MGGIASIANGFVSDTGAVDGLKGGKRDTGGCCGAAAVPHSDEAGQDALNGA